MAVYPVTPKPFMDSVFETRKEAIQTESEAAYIMSRPRCTRSKELFTLNYRGLTLEQFQSLRTFFLENQGKNFTFLSPFDGIIYSTTFNMDSIKPTRVGVKINTTVTLIEV
jgi:hypothetical protein